MGIKFNRKELKENELKKNDYKQNKQELKER